MSLWCPAASSWGRRSPRPVSRADLALRGAPGVEAEPPLEEHVGGRAGGVLSSHFLQASEEPTGPTWSPASARALPWKRLGRRRLAGAGREAVPRGRESGRQAAGREPCAGWPGPDTALLQGGLRCGQGRSLPQQPALLTGGPWTQPRLRSGERWPPRGWQLLLLLRRLGGLRLHPQEPWLLPAAPYCECLTLLSPYPVKKPR